MATTAPPPLGRNGSSMVVFEGARRNTAPLGSLQTGGRRLYDFEGSVRADPPTTVRSTGLARTGVARLPIVRWYHNELSGELALREVLDAVESCVGAEHKERRDLVDAVRLYGQVRFRSAACAARCACARARAGCRRGPAIRCMRCAR
jgi:hypothetical protein